VVQAHGARKDLIGKSLWDFRDRDGVYPARNTVEVAKTKGSGLKGIDIGLTQTSILNNFQRANELPR
jgi:hypothetical protein